jgi:uncharacterized protein (DUF111 family)
VKQIEDPGERITPTGAALLAEFVATFGPQPEMQVQNIGYGAGTRDPHSHPNLLRAIMGRVRNVREIPTTEATPAMVVEISCNLDDCTPEVLSAAMDSLFAAGALDVHVVTCQMKKSRSGFLVTVLAREQDREEMCRRILRETTAFGVRWHRRERMILERSEQTVETPFGPVKIKIGKLDGAIIQASPEFSSCQEAAQRCAVPVQTVFRSALQAASGLL